MKIRRHLLARLLRRPEPGEDGMGDATAAAPAVDTASPAPTPASEATAVGPAAPGPAPAAAPAADAPKSMLDAISAVVSGYKEGEGAGGKPAEPGTILGPDGKPLPAAAADAGKSPLPAEPKPTDKPEDLTAMPEGVTGKAAERFQRLANTNRELTQQNQQLTEAQTYFTSQLREHQVAQPQFEQAVKVIGMLNSGNVQGFIAAVQDQLRQVSVMHGLSVPGVDRLEGHADLREAVDNLQMSESAAAEVARARVQTGMAQQQQRQALQQRQEAEQAQRREQQTQQAVQAGAVAVDQVVKHLQSTDLDYTRIEAILMPQVNKLFAHLPPDQWAAAFQTQYQLLKSVGAPAQRPAAGPVGTLRAGGANNPQAKASSMFDAMFGGAQA